ncbi:MAG: GYD domain-containing protein [Actinomycetota bacterium]
MPKYLLIVSYTADGTKGILKDGGVARRDAVAKMLAEVGGQLDSLHFAFGEDDVYAICDLPDNATAAGIGLKLGASGAVTARTVVLLSPEEIDRATKVNFNYQPPGS